jgi:hypothetical protein
MLFPVRRTWEEVMAKVRLSGKAPHGDFHLETDVADEHVAAVVASALGHGVTTTPNGRVQRRGQPAKPSGRRSLALKPAPLSDQEAAALKAKIPSRAKVAEFISAQPGRRHSLEIIAEKFLGKVPKALSPNNAERRVFFQLQNRITDARADLAREDKSGKFEVENLQFGKSRVYRWVRDGESGKTQ